VDATTKQDPRDRLTDFITQGTEQPAQKTLITCREQLEYYFAWRNLGREPGLEFFAQEVENDMELCMSVGKPSKPRSEQIVEMFKSIEMEEATDTGLQPIQQYIRKRKE